MLIAAVVLVIVAWVALRCYVAFVDPKLNDVNGNPHAYEDYMREMLGLPPLQRHSMFSGIGPIILYVFITFSFFGLLWRRRRRSNAPLAIPLSSHLAEPRNRRPPGLSATTGNPRSTIPASV